MLNKFLHNDSYIGCIKRVLGKGTVLPHFHEYYEFEIYLSGSGVTYINGEPYPIQAGTVMLITPADVHKYVVVEEITVLNMAFVPEAIEYSTFMERLYPMKYVIATLDTYEIERVVTYVEQINREIENGDRYGKKYISLLLSCLLIELYRKDRVQSAHGDEDDSSYLPVQRAIYYVRAHFKDNITLKDAADFAGVSSVALSKKFSEQLGIGFKEYLVDMRLDYARMLILNTSEQITNIAYYSGFNSLSYFQRVFMEKYRMTPKNYRRSLSEGQEVSNIDDTAKN
ncbi:MAG: helix-turn-helix domain-containing protein [Clostridia bacterium]|nr:helix-turn-helix domain-containing protein [Clostridia bacterium]